MGGVFSLQVAAGSLGTGVGQATATRIRQMKTPESLHLTPGGAAVGDSPLSPGVAELWRWPMKRSSAIWLLCLVVCGCISTASRSDIPPQTQKAITNLKVGMTVQEAVEIMKPVCLDCGTVYLGGTGQRDIYFQISPTRQIFVSTGPVWQDSAYHYQDQIVRISSPEPKTVWKRGRSYEMCG